MTPEEMDTMVHLKFLEALELGPVLMTLTIHPGNRYSIMRDPDDCPDFLTRATFEEVICWLQGFRKASEYFI